MLGPLAARNPGPKPLACPTASGFQWGYLRNATFDGTDLVRTLGGNGWGESGANSSQTVIPGDGALQAVLVGTTEREMCGLSPDRAEVYTGIDFAWYCRDTGQLYASANGSLTLVSTWADGDVMKIDVRSSVAKLYKNDGLLHTFAAAAVGPFWVCADLYQSGVRIRNAQIIP